MGKQSKLLVVEDNRETQLLIKVSLRKEFDIHIADCANDAMLQLAKNHFDLVLLDVNLNGQGDGKSILINIREKMQNSKLPVIVTTAYDLNFEDKKFFDENANGFVQKPFVKNELLTSIRQVLMQN
jgi:two-component system, sensor histidine kinase ChiS